MRDSDDEDLERAAANLGINLSRNESAVRRGPRLDRGQPPFNC